MKLLREVEEKAHRKEGITLAEAEKLNATDDSVGNELFRVARELKERVLGEPLTFYSTGKEFPTISLTGNSCALNCKHCGRHLLDSLYESRNNEGLVKLCKSFEDRGAVGCLLTGGCRSDSSVPIDEFIPAIREIKKSTRLLLLAHTGIISQECARALADAGLDGASLDVVGLPEVAERVYGVRIPEDAYVASLRALQYQGIKFLSPHVTVGLDFGKTGHELRALNLISCIKPTSIEITALRPVRGTPMENTRVRPIEAAKIIAIAQLMFPSTPIILGCAHSIGMDRALIEELAIAAGASGIALPTSRTRRFAEEMGIKVRKQTTCCAIPYAKKLWGKDDG